MTDDTVVVFSAGSIAELLTARMLLTAEEIPFVVEGEGIQDLFGFGRTIGGYNPITGAPRIRVRREDAAAAFEALEELRNEDEGESFSPS